MENYFEKLDFTIPDIQHVKIDVGLGRYNINSCNWLNNEDNLLVIGFDPNQDSVVNSSMYINYHLQHRTNNHFFILPVALSNVETPSQLPLYKTLLDSGTSSLFEPVDENIGPVKEVEMVPVFSLKHFFELFPWDRFPCIEYLKVDAQGADLEILKGAGSYLSERIIYVTAEAESKQYKNIENNTEDNFDAYMLSQNFVRVKHPNTTDPTYLNTKYTDMKDNVYIYQQ